MAWCQWRTSSAPLEGKFGAPLACLFLVVFFSSVSPHQKLDITSVINLQIPFGNLNTHMTYEGIASATDLNKISLPCMDSTFCFHPFRRWQTLSTRCWKIVPKLVMNQTCPGWMNPLLLMCTYVCCHRLINQLRCVTTRTIEASAWLCSFAAPVSSLMWPMILRSDYRQKMLSSNMFMLVL